MKKLNLIASDIGAGNGRIFLAEFDGSNLIFKEVHRFQNNPVKLAGTLYWDILKVMDELVKGAATAANRASDNIRCIGVDTLGADFGLIDGQGSMISNPVCYRDKSVEDLEKYAKEVISNTELDRLNCSRTYRHCTLFRLYYTYRFRKETAKLIDKYLPLSNLINYFLTGIKNIEPSMLAGSQFFNVKTRQILKNVLDLFFIKASIVPELSKPGTIIGDVKGEVSEIAGFDRGSKVALVCGHDTASAVTGIPMDNVAERCCFIICGTWSVVGMETENPILNKKLMEQDFTNWCGYRDRNLLVKIFSGFYFIQECKKVWEKEDGKEVSYETLYSGAENDSSPGVVADLTSGLLLAGDRTMPERFVHYFRATSQEFEYSRKNIVSAILCSIVLSTGQAVWELEKYSGVPFDTVYLTGGGSRIAVFCRWLADCTGKNVISGHPEATINGNFIAQLIALGEIKDIGQGRDIVSRSFKVKRYCPCSDSEIDWGRLAENINFAQLN
jgi:sugar (pentulose or hexulose) kinase